MIRTETCQRTVVTKGPCHNGTKRVQITSHVRENGICTPIITKSKVHCDLDHKNLCKCAAVGDPHYRTYDGQSIHFYGDCRYTLTKHRSGNCGFNVEVQNEFREGNKFFTYTKSVTVQMFGKTYELGKNNILRINNNVSPIPHSEGDSVRIFKSRQFLQFISPKCSVRVAFDGYSNAFVEVSKKYSSKMTGLCGDCNGKKDDFRTKSGLDVSKKKNKFSLIGDSYGVSSGGVSCKPANDVRYEYVCGHDWVEKLKADKFCGGIKAKNSAFRKCGDNGHVDLQSYFEDCLIDMCVNKNKQERSAKVRCDVLNGLAEDCASAGFPGIRWRSKFNCPMKCGANQHFSLKATSCPQTCENYFYGTKNPCYDIPYREGCECKEGFIRDGSRCVKPEHCKCINLCVDRESSQKCREWKEKGVCTELPEQMKMICPKTCGKCKPTSGNCEDELSTYKCTTFRSEGLCYHEFYKALCGLTCNYDKCRCGEDGKKVGKCNQKTNIQTTLHYKYTRDSLGQCAKVVKKTYRICNCKGSRTTRGKCNLCTGKRKNVRHYKEIVGNKCVRKTQVIFEECGKCLKNSRCQTKCLNHKTVQRIHFFNKLNGCFACVPSREVKSKTITCKNSRHVRDDKLTCLRHITTITERPVNCKCDRNVRKDSQVYCCNKKPERPAPFCVNGKLIQRTITYKFEERRCMPIFDDKIIPKKCITKTPLKKGVCQRYKDGKCYCKATDVHIVRRLNKNCKCEAIRTTRQRTCCCPLAKTEVHCRREVGIIEKITTSYKLELFEGVYRCKKSRKVDATTVTQETKYTTIKGKCEANCVMNNKIMKTFRDGCKIVTRFEKNEQELCCCRPSSLTHTKCIRNAFFVTKVYKRNLVNGECIKTLVNSFKNVVRCPPKKEIVSDCIFPNKKRKVTIITQCRKNCKCKARKVERLEDCVCRYREFNERYLECNKETCKKIRLIDIENEKCIPGQKKCEVNCCCKLPPIQFFYCDQSTGIKYVTEKISRLNEQTGQCGFVSNKKSITVKCKAISVKRGRCGEEKKDYLKISTTRWVHDRVSCACKPQKSVIWKICSCSRPKKVTRKCRGVYFHVKEISWHLNKAKTKCIPKEEVHQDKVACERRFKKTIENITKCIYKIHTQQYSVKNCECKIQKRVAKRHKCCDEPPKRSKRCVNENRIIRETTTHVLSVNKRKCSPVTQKKEKIVVCTKQDRVYKTKCREGSYEIVTEVYRVTGCKCVEKITRVKKSCTCKPQSVRVICSGCGFKTITTNYKYDCDKARCVATETFKFARTKCQRPREVSGKCNHVTGEIRVERFYFELVKCKCIQKVFRFGVKCECRQKERVVRKPCDKLNKRVVEVLRYKRVKGACSWTVEKTFHEDCRCPNAKKDTTCVNHSFYRTTTVTYELKTFNEYVPLQRCIRRENVQNKGIVCNNPYDEKKCVAHRKIFTTHFWIKVNCKCQKKCKSVFKGPCNCSKKRICKMHCIKNVNTEVCTSQKPGKEKCEPCRVEYPRPKACPKETKTCEKEFVLKNNGYYRCCTTRSYRIHNCRCLKTDNRDCTFVYCKKDRRHIKKCINNRPVVVEYFYERVDNMCVEREKFHPKQLVCARTRLTRSTKPDKCNTEYTLTYYVKENCKCVKRVTVKKNPKCCQPATVDKICKDKFWLYVQKRTQRILLRVKLFTCHKYKLRAAFCRIVKKEWVKNIKCEPDYVTRICNTKTDVLSTTRYFYTVENCKCKENVKVTTTKCTKCPAKKIDRSGCGARDDSGRAYVDIKITYYKKLPNNTCQKAEKRVKEICKCPKPKKSEICKDGKRIFLSKWYNIYSKPPCEELPRNKEEAVPCYKKENWILIRVVRCKKPGDFTVKHYERQKFDPVLCSCKRVYKSVKTGICCHPGHRKVTCRKNYFEFKSTCYKPTNLKCVPKVTIKKKSTVCLPPSKTVEGNCHGHVITYKLTSYNVVNCKCIRKIKYEDVPKQKNRKECVNNKIRITRVLYTLINERCVAQPPVESFIGIPCSASIRFVDKKLNDCEFERTFIGKEVKNCRCVDRVVNKKILKSQCCDKPTEKTVCAGHVDLVTTITKFQLRHFQCFPVTDIRRKSIRCHKKPPKRTTTGRCTYKVEYFTSTKKNCKCHYIVKRTERKESCCDHRKPHVEKKCDEKNGVHITNNYKFHLSKNDVCVEVKKQCKRPVKCDRLKCSETRTQCKGRTSTVKMYCFKREGCKCVKTLVKEYQQCCGGVFIWSKKGKCDQHKKYFIRIRYYKLELNKKINRCQAKVTKETYQRCGCRKPHETKVCVHHNSIKTTTHLYVLKDFVCEHVKRDSIKLIPGCGKRTTVKISAVCNKKTGWSEVTFETRFPKDCKCEVKRFTQRRICICCVAFPAKKRQYCKNNNVIVFEKKVPRCTLFKVTWKIHNIFKPILECNRVKIEIGECFESRNGYAATVRWLTHVQYYVEKCKCLRKVIKKELKHCTCIKNHCDNQCVGKARVYTSHSYILVNGQCTKKDDKQVRPVPCSTKPVITKSKCHKNKYIVSRRTFSINNCQCNSQVKKKICDCVCPKDSVTRKCSKKYRIIQTTFTYQRKNCRCHSSRSQLEITPKCPKVIGVQIGKCIPGKDFSYRVIITRKIRKNHRKCKCEVDETKREELCSCVPKITQHSSCQQNSIVITTRGFRLSRKLNKCVPCSKTASTLPVICPDPKVTTDCNKVTGKAKDTTVRFRIEKCKCVAKTTVENYACKCDKTPVLVSEGECAGHPTCMRIDKYRHQVLRNRRCVTVFTNKSVRCCCAKPKLTRTCEQNVIVIRTVSFTLQNHVCIKNKKRDNKKNKCSLKIYKQTSKCGKDGFKTIQLHQDKLRNCKCVREKIKEYRCRCKCKDNQVKHVCHQEGKFISTIFVNYKLSGCKCKRVQTCKRKYLLPPQDVARVTACERVAGKDYSIKKYIKISYSLNSKCKFVPSERVRTEICDCIENPKITKTCDNNKHEIVTTRSFTILKNHRCVRTSKSKSRPIYCNANWKLTGESQCRPNGQYGTKNLIYTKYEHDKCACKQVTKVKPCDCDCTGKEFSEVCLREQIHHKRYLYKVANCKCRRLVVSERVIDMKCAKRAAVYAKQCTIRNRRCERRSTHYDVGSFNCKCFQKPREVIEPCQTCKTRTCKKRRCNKRTNRMEDLFVRYEIQPDGLLRKRVTIKIIPMRCSAEPICVKITPCNKRSLTQQYKCKVPHIANCQCLTREFKKTYPCRCKPKKITKGDCDRKSCFRPVTITRSHLIVLKNGKHTCEDERKVKKERCCCGPNPKPVVTCINNRLIKKRKTIVFNEDRKTCSILEKKCDVTPPCPNAIRPVRGECNKKTCILTIHTTHLNLIKCNCQKKVLTSTKPCCCLKKDRVETKCLAGDIFAVYNHRYSFQNGKCSKTVDVKKNTIKCKKPRIERLRCNLLTRKRIVRTFTHQLKNCKCIPKVDVKEILCRCRESHSAVNCIKDKGILRRTCTSYRLSERKNICYKQERHRDQQIECHKMLKVSCRKCQHKHSRGVYKQCSTSWNTRTDCKCNKHSKCSFVLCHCYKESNKKLCLKNKLVRRTIYYEKIKSTEKKYDLTCVRREKVIPLPSKPCPKGDIHSTPCVKAFKTYTKNFYTYTGCRCVRQTKVFRVPCSCPPRKKIGRKCVNDDTQSVTYRFYKLICTKSIIPSCKCISLDKSVNKAVKCPPDVFLSGCKNGEEIQSWTVYAVMNCKCVSQSQSLKKPNCVITYCQDVLPKHECEMIKKTGKCKGRSEVFDCPQTCNYCEKCKKPSIGKYLTACSCKIYAGKRVCFRKLEVTIYRNKNRKCVAKRKVVNSLCDCVNKRPEKVCREAHRRRECDKPSVRENCAYHCNPKCKRCDVDESYKLCEQKGPNKGRYQFLRIKYFNQHGISMFKLERSHEGFCKVCDPTPFTVVRKCHKGKRVVLTKYVEKQADGSCVNKEKREILSCADCCTIVEKKIGSCNPNSRVVVSTFWSNVKGFCRKHTVSNVYACNNKCSDVKIRSSKCLYNKKLIIKTWFSDSACAPHSYHALIDCCP